MDRIANIDKQLANPPKPLKFDSNGLARLSGWEPKQFEGDAVAEMIKEEDKPRLKLSCKTPGSIISWRTPLMLSQGRYTFEGRVKTVGVKATKEPNFGVGLRISGEKDRPVHLVGNKDWQVVKYDFEVTDALAEVVLVCELHANSGTALFPPRFAGASQTLRLFTSGVTMTPPTRKLGNSNLQVSRLCFGGNIFGWTVDQARSFQLLDAFVEAGFNFVDTADIYSRWVPGNQGGESETIIGNWFKQSGQRDKVILATKVGLDMGNGDKGLSKAYIVRAVEKSLKRLQTDYIDLYQSHTDDAETPMEETMNAFDTLVKQGKVCVMERPISPPIAWPRH